jgi:hypothetical protein
LVPELVLPAAPEFVLPADLFMLPDMFEFDMFEFDVMFELLWVVEGVDVLVFIVVAFEFAGLALLLFVVLSPPQAIIEPATTVSAIAVSVFFIVSS